MITDSTYLRAQRQRYRESFGDGFITAVWESQKLPANQHIPDHAFVQPDEYEPRNYEARVVTQHAPHLSRNTPELKLSCAAFLPKEIWLNKDLDDLIRGNLRYTAGGRLIKSSPLPRTTAKDFGPAIGVATE